MTRQGPGVGSGRPAHPTAPGPHRRLERDLGQGLGCRPWGLSTVEASGAGAPRKKYSRIQDGMCVGDRSVAEPRSPRREYGAQTFSVLVSQAPVPAHKVGFRVSNEVGVPALEETPSCFPFVAHAGYPPTHMEGSSPFQIIVLTKHLWQDAPLSSSPHPSETPPQPHPF